jgi:hypothetical protein
MADLEEVMEMGKKVTFNPKEQKKYKVHIDKIRYNQQKAAAWRRMNYLWQLFFFGGLFVAAMVMLFAAISKYDVPYSTTALDISLWIEAFLGGPLYFMTVLAFPLMMWTGVIRSKWEGALTRSTAYALSFMENIEHRMYLEEKLQVRPQKQLKQ